MLSDNETDKITTEEADRSLQIESWKLSKLKIKSIYNTGCNNRDASVRQASGFWSPACCGVPASHRRSCQPWVMWSAQY